MDRCLKPAGDVPPNPEQGRSDRNGGSTDSPSSRDRSGTLLFPAGGRSPFDQLPSDVAACLKERLGGAAVGPSTHSHGVRHPRQFDQKSHSSRLHCRRARQRHGELLAE